MPELLFKGKEYVYNHHLTVPYRPLVPHADRSIGPGSLDGNLIIHGDNLHALKALMPRYAGQVDLVFIDPPYNTGNEGWCYSDSVRAPFIQEWLSANPVGVEDSLRHDKWLAMMWPRLTLLRDLLSERGSLWMTLDDNEVHRARMMLDEVFGAENFIGTAIWEKGDSPRMDAERFSSRHDYVLSYAKRSSDVLFSRIGRTERLSHYNRSDEEGRPFYLKPLRAMGSGDDTRVARPSLYFAMTAPDGNQVFPKKEDGSDGRWRWSPRKVETDGARIEWRKTSNGWVPYYRIYGDTQDGTPPETIFFNTAVGSSRAAKSEVKQLFTDDREVFETPKPTGLLARILEIATDEDSLILDSFAGSGTTAHAVLKANAADNGSRRFILVEGEDYADRLTAERVRRVMCGYGWQGTQREELLNEKLTWTQLQKADQLLAKVQAIKVREGFADGDLADRANAAARRFDNIATRVVDGALIVEGEKRIDERVPGLGGEFTYCTLGEPIDVEKMLSGERLPAYRALGEWLFHTATGAALPAGAGEAPEWYLAEAQDRHVWLVYRPDLAFLTSPDAALTLTLARRIGEWSRTRGGGKKSLVFAPAKYLSNRQLADEGVEFAALPFALYREG
jgi:adenine-specific DNA-methyltransferase